MLSPLSYGRGRTTDRYVGEVIGMTAHRCLRFGCENIILEPTTPGFYQEDASNQSRESTRRRSSPTSSAHGGLRRCPLQERPQHKPILHPAERTGPAQSC